jgi:deazaflavin-dependent oxidoreductase (nitroreductase family)
LMHDAGAPGAYASVVRHVGRRSGKTYETPVRAVTTDGGFAIALPYGQSSDWVKNVLATGAGTVVYEGATYRIDEPYVVQLAAVESSFTRRDQRAHRVFGVEECLLVRRT